MFGSKSYYTNPDWVLPGDAPSDYKDIVYGNANYGSSAPYRNIVNRRSFGSPRNYGFFMTQNPAQYNPQHGRASHYARRAGMRIPASGYGAPSGAGKIPCLSTGATDAQVAKDYPELGNWVTTVQEKLYSSLTPILTLAPNGTFDGDMKALVKEFQKLSGFGTSDQDGIIGPMTYKKLFGTSDRYLSCSSSGGSGRSGDSSSGSSSPPSTIGDIPFYMKPWFYWTVGGVFIVGAIGLVLKK